VRRSAAHLRESLTKPAAFVPEEFASAEVMTASGETVRGVRANEDSFTIQIKDGSGQFHSFRKGDLKSLRVSLSDSRMPAYDRLAAGELDDLVAYLASLKGEE
jgi:hypothetical protein